MQQFLIKAATSVAFLISFVFLESWLKSPAMPDLWNTVAIIAFVTIANVLLTVLDGTFSVEVGAGIAIASIATHYGTAYLVCRPEDGAMLFLTKATILLISSCVAAASIDTLLKDKWLCFIVRNSIGR